MKGPLDTVSFSPILGDLFKKSMDFHEVKRDSDARRLSGSVTDIESGTACSTDGENDNKNDDDNNNDNEKDTSNDTTLPAAPSLPPPPRPSTLNYFAIPFSCHKQRYYYLILDLLLSECIDLWSRLAVEVLFSFRVHGWNAANYAPLTTTSVSSLNCALIPLNFVCILCVLWKLPKTLTVGRVWTYVLQEGWYLSLVMACVCMFCGGVGELHHGYEMQEVE